jgi:type II secretory pathway component PulF
MMGKVKSRERALLFRSLQVLFAAGITLPNSLRILTQQVKGKALKEALKKIEERVLTGVAFSQAVKEFPFIFSDHCRRTIEVAEAAGALPQVLERLSEYEERTYRSELLFRQALVYPAWILTVCIVFVVWIPPFLFGELFTLLETSGVELPLITRGVLLLSKIVGSPFFYLAVCLALFFGARTVISILESPQNRYRFYRLLRTNKFMRQQITAYATCRFSRCLEMMAEVGVPITQALKLAGNAAGDPVLKRRIPTSIEAMINGASLEQALEQLDYFSKPFLSTIRLGQEAGALADVLKKIVVLFETELEYRAQVILASLEPLAMLMMGLTVGVFIIATMSPLMELIQGL